MVAVVSNKALETFLAPLAAILDREDVAEISINEPGEVFIEGRQGMERQAIPELDLRWLRTLAELIAQDTGQVVSAAQPLLSAWLPSGERVQVVYPPACGAGTIVFSIRKQTVQNMSLGDYEAAGAFRQAEVVQLDLPDVVHSTTAAGADRELAELLGAGRVREFLTLAVQAKKNILISGGTSTGKTTLLNAVLKEIPGGDAGDRIITIEDVRELMLAQPNRVHLVASKGDQGVAKVTPASLLEACLRLRPDRIIMGEIRGAEAYNFLEAVNTGHEGSITSIHANGPAAAFERLVLMGLRAGLGLSREDILGYAGFVLDIVVQLRRIDGQRLVTEIYYRHAQG